MHERPSSGGDADQLSWIEDEAEPDQPGEPTFSVAELGRLLQHAVALTFPDDVWVEGEISGLKRHAGSGHVYFQLVDASETGRADATLAVALYKRDKGQVNATLTRAGGAMRMDDGVHIRIRGRLEFYAAQGRVQLRMKGIDPAFTLGRLTAARDRVLAALVAERLLERNRALPFPLVPLHIGLITGGGSAAEADFLHELRASAMTWRVSFAPTAVQGAGADRSIARSLRTLEAIGVDVIALVRGGGARTDLLAFDSEVVARTIAGLSVPVVTGVGHETDASVADAVAARVFKTPTACAAALVHHARDAHQHAEAAWQDIVARSTVALEHGARALEVTANRVAARTRSQLVLAERGVGEAQHRLARGTTATLDRATLHVTTAEVRARALDPARTLARGWSITRDRDGAVVRDPAAVRAGDPLTITVAGGEIAASAGPARPETPDPRN